MVKYIIIILVLLSFQAEGQIIRANPFYTSRTFVAPSTDTLLLDSFPTQGAAYSLRKLRTNYTGDCIRVRRTSNNNEQDIGFVNNFLDTASLKTFVGSSNGFVTTWYDQGDSARDASNATAANQPKIYDSATASLSKRNGKVSLTLDGTDFFNLANPGFILRDKGYAYNFAVTCNTNTSTSRAILFISTTTSTARLLHSYNQVTANRINIGGRRLDANSFVSISSNTNYSTTDLALNVGILDYANSDAFLYENSTQTASTTTFQTDGNTSNTTSAFVRIFAQGTAGNAPIIGSASEVIFYNTDQSANRTAIENNINRNWLIY
jgi:hypothetical protein